MPHWWQDTLTEKIILTRRLLRVISEHTLPKLQFIGQRVVSGQASNILVLQKREEQPVHSKQSERQAKVKALSTETNLALELFEADIAVSGVGSLGFTLLEGRS